MNSNYDAIIIGAGVIGACTAFEMAKKGYRTLNIDKGPQAGYGSTSGSCAIIRTYYSTTASCALAYEGWFYWSNWADYLGVTDHNTGNLVIKTVHNNRMADVTAMMDEIGCPYEHLSIDEIAQWVPDVDTRAYAPAKLAAAVRNAVGINEIHNFGKYLVTGAGARDWLDWIMAGRVPSVGWLSLTPMLSPKGRIIGDFTISALAEDCFQLTASYGLQVEIEILGEMRPATLITEMLFDADGACRRG